MQLNRFGGTKRSSDMASRRAADHSGRPRKFGHHLRERCDNSHQHLAVAVIAKPPDAVAESNKDLVEKVVIYLLARRQPMTVNALGWMAGLFWKAVLATRLIQRDRHELATSTEGAATEQTSNRSEARFSVAANVGPAS